MRSLAQNSHGQEVFGTWAGSMLRRPNIFRLPVFCWNDFDHPGQNNKKKTRLQGSWFGPSRRYTREDRYWSVWARSRGLRSISENPKQTPWQKDQTQAKFLFSSLWLRVLVAQQIEIKNPPSVLKKLLFVKDNYFATARTAVLFSAWLTSVEIGAGFAGN